MSNIADSLKKKEIELASCKEKLKRLEAEIKVQKKKESARLRKKRTRNLIQFGAIITSDLGIDPLSEEDLNILKAFLDDYVAFAYTEQSEVYYSANHKIRYEIFKKMFAKSEQIPLLRKKMKEQKKGG